MKINSTDLFAQYQNIKTDIDSAIFEVIKNDSFILGKHVSLFEQNLANYLNLDSQQVITCASGSDALLLCLMTMNLSSKDEIITTPFTFFATASCIHRIGAKIVFVDVAEDFNIDIELIKQKINKKTKAIISVDLYGCPAKQIAIKQLCKKYGLIYISDSSQSLGSDIDGIKTGNIADFTTFSFFPTKNLGCYGDGGALICLNKKIAQKIRQLRLHGSQKKYYYNYVGINSRLDTIQAAILDVKLKYLDLWNDKRKHIANLYTDQIKQYQNPQSKNGHVYHQYTILCSHRNKLKKDLLKHNIPSTIYYPLPLHLQKCFRYLGHKRGDFPKSEKFAKHVLSLPIHDEITEKEINYILKTINNIYYDYQSL